MTEITRSPASILLIHPFTGYLWLFILQRHHISAPASTKWLLDVFDFSVVGFINH
jgi:hypothetical protein